MIRWALFLLACASLYVSYRLGIQTDRTSSGMVFLTGWIGGAVAAGLIGAASALGAAIADRSDCNRKP